MDLIFEPDKSSHEIEEIVSNYVIDNEIALMKRVPTIFIYQDHDLDGKIMMMENTFRLGKFIHAGLNHTTEFKRCMVIFEESSGMTYVMFSKHDDMELPAVIDMVIAGNC